MRQYGYIAYRGVRTPEEPRAGTGATRLVDYPGEEWGHSARERRWRWKVTVCRSNTTTQAICCRPHT
jgi:hypothetical protein